MSAELSELMPSRRHEALRIIGDQHSNPVHEIITAWAISVTISSGPQDHAQLRSFGMFPTFRRHSSTMHGAGWS